MRDGHVREQTARCVKETAVELDFRNPYVFINLERDVDPAVGITKHAGFRRKREAQEGVSHEKR